MSTHAVTPETPPAVTPDPKKFSRTIHPKDAAGNYVGQPQTYYGATEQEVIDKLADAQDHATIKIRELSRQTTLETPTFTAPEGADPFEDIPNPTFRELTPEDRTNLAAKFSKPETTAEAFDEMYEARTGLKPQQASKLQVQQARDAAQMKALTAARLFMDAHPDFVPCPENKDALDQFLRTRKIGPTLKNFELAYKELTAGGLLVLRTEEPEAPVTVGTIPEARIEPVVETPPQSVIPTSLTRSSASGGGTPAKKKGPTAKELAEMTADQLRKHYESIGQWPSSAKAIR